jgi:hypothetical protein
MPNFKAGIFACIDFLVMVRGRRSLIAALRLARPMRTSI